MDGSKTDFFKESQLIKPPESVFHYGLVKKKINFNILEFLVQFELGTISHRTFKSVIIGRYFKNFRLI